MMRTTHTMPPSEKVLRLPADLASKCTIVGLNPSQLRIAIVLAALAYEGPSGEWTVAKALLERLTHVVLDSADDLLAPVRTAKLQKDDAEVPLFQHVDYTPGVRFKTGGTITARLSFEARELLASRGQFVLIAADEFRKYSTIGGILLRIRLGARMQSMSTSKLDIWRLKPEDLEKSSVFGSYASMASISRTVKGQPVSYVSMSRAMDTLIQRGVDEINKGGRGAKVEVKPLKSGPDARARWLAVELETRRVFDGKPVPKPTMADLGKKAKQPALVAE